MGEPEKVFIKNKKQVKEFGGSEPFNRIVKALLDETKKLQPGERVIVLGVSDEPQIAVKKEQKAFINYFQKHIYVPLPDYASLRALWPALFNRYAGADYRLPPDFELS